LTDQGISKKYNRRQESRPKTVLEIGTTANKPNSGKQPAKMSLEGIFEPNLAFLAMLTKS